MRRTQGKQREMGVDAVVGDDGTAGAETVRFVIDYRERDGYPRKTIDVRLVSAEEKGGRYLEITGSGSLARSLVIEPGSTNSITVRLTD